MKQSEQTLETYVYRAIAAFATPSRSIFCNTVIKHLQHTSKTFNVISPCYLGMKVHRHVEFTDVELASGAELAAPMEKDTASPMEKAATLEHRGG
jgi:hypothetical protein